MPLTYQNFFFIVAAWWKSCKHSIFPEIMKFGNQNSITCDIYLILFLTFSSYISFGYYTNIYNSRQCRRHSWDCNQRTVWICLLSWNNILSILDLSISRIFVSTTCSICHIFSLYCTYFSRATKGVIPLLQLESSKEMFWVLNCSTCLWRT